MFGNLLGRYWTRVIESILSKCLGVAVFSLLLVGCSVFTKYEDDGNTCWSGRNGVTQCQENENIVNPPIQL
jgi:hypothetical protein